jgi:hypothetical protein
MNLSPAGGDYSMIPQSGNRFSDKIMRQEKTAQQSG